MNNIKRFVITLFFILSFSIIGNTQIEVGAQLSPCIEYYLPNQSNHNTFIGVIANYKVSKSSSLKSTIAYQHSKYDLSGISHFADRYYYIPYDSKHLNFEIDYQYCFLNRRKFSAYTSSGLSANISLQEKLQHVNTDIEAYAINEMRAYSLVLTLGVGMSYSINRIKLFYEPNLSGFGWRNLNYYKKEGMFFPYSIQFHNRLGFYYKLESKDKKALKNCRGEWN